MTRTAALAATVLAAAGFAIAILALPHSASAWDLGSLPAGFAYDSVSYDSTSGTYTYEVVYKPNGTLVAVTHILYGTAQYPAAPTDANFQANLDAFVNAHYTAPVTTTAPTTTAATTTATTTAATTTTTGTTTAPTSTVTQTVTVPGATPPTSAFTYTPTGLAVTFTDASTAGSSAITTVTWLFGDGANDAGTTVSHTYTASGTFNVVELVTDSNGLIDRSTQAITVSPFGGSMAFAETTSVKLATATTIAFGRPLAVYCVKSWGKAKPERGYGLTIIGSHQANMWQKGCTALATKRGPVALALLVLGHESAHALGIKSERTADCFGLKKIPLLEKRLGITDHGYRATDSRYVHRKWGRC